jgi:hypothetical protein
MGYMKNKKRRLKRSNIRKMQAGGMIDESNLFYVKYNTRLTTNKLNAKKSEHGLVSIKHATKRTDLIPSAANVVVVGIVRV